MFELSIESYRNDDYTLYQFNLTTGLPYSEIPGNTHSIHFVRLHLIYKKNTQYVLRCPDAQLSICFSYYKINTRTLILNSYILSMSKH